MRAPPSRPGVAGRALVAVARVALALGLCCTACTPGPLSATGPDASTSAAVCANLARFDCALGTDPQCASRIGLSISEQRVDAAQLACARNASTRAALEACSPYFACP